MSVYVDTSAFLAVIDADDNNHLSAKKTWGKLLESQEELLCSSYVLVETYALIQRRLGIEALRMFNENIFPILQIEWIDGMIHMQASSSVLTSGRKDLSLVDCASFAVMRQNGITDVFSFDKHFKEQGFRKWV